MRSYLRPWLLREDFSLWKLQGPSTSHSLGGPCPSDLAVDVCWKIPLPVITDAA